MMEIDIEIKQTRTRHLVGDLIILSGSELQSLCKYTVLYKT